MSDVFMGAELELEMFDLNTPQCESPPPPKKRKFEDISDEEEEYQQRFTLPDFNIGKKILNISE